MKPKAEVILEILASNPFRTPPPYEKLVGDLKAHTPAGSIFNTVWSTRFSKNLES